MKLFNFRPVLLFAAFGVLSVTPAVASSESGHNLGRITRFEQVTSTLYRGSRPTNDSDRTLLLNLGIKTLLNLQGDSSEVASVEGDREFARTHGMDFEYVGMRSEWYNLIGPIPAPKLPFASVKDEDVIKALRVLADPSLQPVFVHCQHGKDRTGLIVGLYKVFYLGVDRDAAYSEMRKIGFTPMEFELQAYWDSNAYIGSPLYKKLF